MVKRRKAKGCTRKIGVARKRCKGKKGAKLKKCLRRVMCGPKKRKARRKKRR